MVAEQHGREAWKRKLLEMGYQEDDVLRASEAHITNVTDALDWLISNPSQQPPNTSQQWPPADTSAECQTNSNDALLSSSTNQHGPSPNKDVLEPRNSNHNDALAHTRSSKPDIATGGTRSHRDEDLQRAMEISRKEQDERDMERALHMSKQEGVASHSADQDPEFIRALEESLKDSPEFVKDRNVSWQSQLYAGPKERVRKNIDQPVGLRNIGNTCYLNSLLQVYYYLPDFRRAIMSFRAPYIYSAGQVDQAAGALHETKSEADTDPAQASRETSRSMPPLHNTGQEGGTSDKSDNQMDKLAEEVVQRNAVDFVVELQRLFATMALGNQNCADPTVITRAMRDNHGNPISIGAQRDAAEFNQLFLDIVEKGLEAGFSKSMNESYRASVARSEGAALPDPRADLVKNMFTVKFRQEILRSSGNNGRNQTDEQDPVTTNWETTSIIVDATTRQDRNLHGGLDDFVHTQIKYHDPSKDNADKLEYSAMLKEESSTERFATQRKVIQNKTPHAAIKTVWFTRLPPVVVIYLQRGSYNRETLRAEKVHDQYDFPTRLAFDRYLEENRKASEAARKEVRAIRKERNRVSNLLDLYKRFPITNEIYEPEMGRKYRENALYDDGKVKQDICSHGGEDFFAAGARIQKRLREAMEPKAALYAISGLTAESIRSSLETIEKVLEHDRKRCNDLEVRLKCLKRETEIYQGLNKVTYDLHAVLVHDGAPDSGHYWAFINNSRSKHDNEQWVKLSDSQVSFVSEKEMLSWSLGGNGKASAYCLMYTNSKHTCEIQSISEESMKLLPQERLDEVAEASAAFEKEVALATTK